MSTFRGNHGSGHRSSYRPSHRYARNSTNSAGEYFAKVFKALFLPYQNHRDHGEERAAYGAYSLHMLHYTLENGQRVSLTRIHGPNSRYSARFDTGEGAYDYHVRDSEPVLCIRYETVSMYGGNRSPHRIPNADTICETIIPVNDIKCISIIRTHRSDYTDLSVPELEEDRTFEVTIKLRSTRRDRYFSCDRPRTRSTYSVNNEVPALNLKNIADRATSLSFQLKASSMAWDRIRQLQRDLGLRHEDGNSSTSFFLSLENIQNNSYDHIGYGSRDYGSIWDCIRDDSPDSCEEIYEANPYRTGRYRSNGYYGYRYN